MKKCLFQASQKLILNLRALDMIVASIAIEELAFSHIINAEDEKLQYILGMLGTDDGTEPDANELLCANKSITSLLDSVSHNQMLLKGKMDKVIEAQSGGCSRSAGPTGPLIYAQLNFCKKGKSGTNYFSSGA